MYNRDGIFLRGGWFSLEGRSGPSIFVPSDNNLAVFFRQLPARSRVRVFRVSGVCLLPGLVINDGSL